MDFHQSKKSSWHKAWQTQRPREKQIGQVQARNRGTLYLSTMDRTTVKHLVSHAYFLIQMTVTRIGH